MKLRYVTNSPYCRKVAIAARLLGLEKRIEMLNNETDFGDAVRSQNPLNKIPILITDSRYMTAASLYVISTTFLMEKGSIPQTRISRPA